MKIFHCDHCGSLVFFENVSCVGCGHALGFLPDIMDLAALEPDKDQHWRSLAAASRGKLYRACANGRDYSVCNWFVPVEEPEEYCAACRLNAMVPDVSIQENQTRWHKIEIAKRRLIFTLRRLSLPTEGDPAQMWPRLQFRFLAETPGMPPVLTGHEDGVITLNIAEADDAEREKRRTQLHEPQRTLVGHFRHESGHYYWDALIASSPLQDDFRLLFGDERADYTEALQTYYTNGPSAGWKSNCVSAYASAHPWEDWAETWAHYLHMVDLLETAAGFGLSLRPRHPAGKTIAADPQKALGRGATFESMLEHWFPLTYSLNSLNRSVGLPDLYPFVLSSPVLKKLRFVHDVIARPDRRTEPAWNDSNEILQPSS
ncbi:MAG: putative zinc-binding peptidase [Verrucomicrobiota bacterium]